ncbi:TolC family protein [Flavobacterium sp. Sd200]|uniref:TolC family protein n=1 Tax=Flavobacterium sp. Sd200 TaxID=2692211 RepID=UPI001369CCF2|nr:TolC family protein [Flavobacterium sp. Sd200]MXN90126.1 TolC family protein [Flavobacterium sp. Sd200]
MKIRKMLPIGFLLITGATMHAQQKQQLSLDEAVKMAVTKSTEANLADTKVETSKLELANTKNTAYPSFTVSGQYLRLTDPTINLKSAGSSSSGESGESSGGSSTPKVNSAMFALANASVPVYAGGKVKNSIAASENAYKAQTFNAADTKDQVALQTIALYTNLYKAQQSVALIEENLKSANQRVKDFTAMEENGLIARNDLLKTKLQASNIQISLDEAKKNVATINYQLITLLHMPESTQIDVKDGYFKNQNADVAISESEAIAQRNDLEAMRYEEKAAENNIKVAKAGYYPSLSLSAGYVYLNIPDFVEVYNAANVGVGLSYDIAGIWKNGKKVKAAESRRNETHQQLDLMTESVKIQVKTAQENYNLALKQNRVYTEAVTQAEENYRIVKDKYDNGLVDTNDLLEADVQKLQTQLNEAFSKADITQRFYELLNASGKLTNSFNLTQNK